MFHSPVLWPLRLWIGWDDFAVLHVGAPGDYREGEMGYTVILEKEPNGEYVAVVPALPGCVTQGATRQEAMSNGREAIELYVIELYIEDCIDAGDPIRNEAGKEFVEVNLPR